MLPQAQRSSAWRFRLAAMLKNASNKNVANYYRILL
jgi:hypothetical protein